MFILVLMALFIIDGMANKQLAVNYVQKIFMYKTISQKLWHIPYMGKYWRVKNWQMDGSESIGK